MEEEPGSPEMREAYPPAAYLRPRFILLLVFLALLVILIGVVQRLGLRSAEGPPVQEAALAGDISMKLSYAYRRWESSLAADRRQKQRIEELQEDYRQSAIAQYRRAVAENRSPGNLRRLIIIQRPSERAAVIGQLGKVGARRMDASGRDLAAEVAMWRDIYVSRRTLQHAQVDEYASRIRRLGLGWYERLALADLFERAGMTAAAKGERAAAAQSASRTVVCFVSLLVALGLLGLVGAAIVIWYVARRAGRGTRAAVQIPSEFIRELRAGLLLEAFVVYLAIVVGTQVAAAVVVAAGMGLRGEISPVGEVFITAGIYALAGVLAMVYLAYRLRSVGWPWEAVGLTTRNPFGDILWGIGGYAAALPLLLIAGALSQLVGRYVQSPTNPVIPLFAETETFLGRAVLFALVGLAAPFFEELFFRGVLFNSFRAKWSVAAGIMLSAAVFASVHPLPVGFLPIFVLGSVFAILLYERGSLLSSMVAHGLNNSVAFALLLILTGK